METLYFNLVLYNKNILNTRIVVPRARSSREKSWVAYSLPAYKIKLISFDSMGSRSMATVVEAGGIKIFIDPGVSYAPRRYGLPPHPIELERFQAHLNKIYDEVSDADYIIITHYHRDHYLYRDNEEEYYRGKHLFIKNPWENINPSQKARAYVLLKKKNVEAYAKTINMADGNKFIIDNRVLLEFSEPAPHGKKGTKLGYVIMAYIVAEDFTLLHASDVQGPMDPEARDFIIDKDPEILIISGPPTYMEGYKVDGESISQALENLVKIIEETVNLKTIIIDHHLLRDLDYKKKISNILLSAEKNNVKVLTAAEYAGKPVEQLEALRKKLWEENQ